MIKKVEGEYQADSRGHAGSGFHLNEHGGANNGDDIMLKVARLNRVVSFSEDFTTDVIDGMARICAVVRLGLSQLLSVLDLEESLRSQCFANR